MVCFTNGSFDLFPVKGQQSGFGDLFMALFREKTISQPIHKLVGAQHGGHFFPLEDLSDLLGGIRDNNAFVFSVLIPPPANSATFPARKSSRGPAGISKG